MVLFDWDKILRHSKGKNKEIIRILKLIVRDKYIPKRKDSPEWQYYGIDFSGSSFILVPGLLLKAAERRYESERDIAQYIGLCSFRNLNTYMLTKNTELPYEDCPVPLDKIKTNRLITFTETGIRFKFEEIS